MITLKRLLSNAAPDAHRGAPGARIEAISSDGEQLPVLAATVRQLRARAKLTLKDLSTRSGIAASTLSKIENGQLSPTYEKIVMLADGLRVDVAELFSSGRSESMVTARRSVCRRGQGTRHNTPQYEYEMLCADVTRKQFLPIVTTLRAHGMTAFSSLLSHEGEEFVYVLAGEVTVHTEHYEPLVLHEGDSCYFDSQMGHALLSSGAQDARILWVCSKNTPMPAPSA